MKIYNRRLLPALLLLILSACEHRQVITLFLTETSHEVYQDYKMSYTDFIKQAETRGYQLALDIVSSDDNSGFVKHFEENKTVINFVDPLISYPAGFLGTQKDSLVFTLGPSLEPNQGSKVLNIIFDDKPVFEKTGKAAAALVDDIPDYLPDDFSPRWGSLVYGIPGFDDRAYKAFKESFEENSTDRVILEGNINSLNDKSRARQIFDDLKSQGVNCYFLRGFTLNSFFMPLIKTNGFYMITSDWNFDLPVKSNILYNINHDPWIAMSEIFDNIDNSEEGLFWKEQVIESEPSLTTPAAIVSN